MRRPLSFCAALLVVAVGALGCDNADFVECDGGVVRRIGGDDVCVPVDGGRLDAGARDGGAGDAGTHDAGIRDAGSVDAGPAVVNDDPDAPDCFTAAECSLMVPFPTLALGPAQEATGRGRLDDLTHTRAVASCGSRQTGDRDVWGVTAPARTLVEVTVRPQVAGGALDAILEVAPASGTVLHFGQADAMGVARVVFLAAADAPMPALVQIDHAANYALDACTQPASAYAGGDTLAYEVRARVLSATPIELGTLTAAGPTLSRTGVALAAPGDIALVRFTLDDPMSTTPEIVLSNVQCPSRTPCTVIAPYDTSTGAARWPDVALTPRTTQDFTQFSFLSGNERLFAVFDFDGGGGPGFTFDLTVRQR